MTEKMMFSLPDKLAHRVRAAIPSRERSKLIAGFLDKEVSAREAELYKAALEFNEKSSFQEEEKIWDEMFANDGLTNV